jgi:hypothetical protein
LPRKYHRPPSTTTKRRKTRRSAVPYEFDAPPADVVEEEASDETADAVPAASAPLRTAAAETRPDRAERHVRVDYSYVRGEVVRSAAIMGFLAVALVITSMFR